LSPSAFRLAQVKLAQLVELSSPWGARIPAMHQRRRG
jgi:hypothetical protein